MTEGHLTDEQLSSHLDGVPGAGLDETASASASFSAHLAGCGPCRERLADLDSVRARLMQAPVPTVPPDIRATSIESVLRRAVEGSAPGFPPSDIQKQSPDLVRIPNPIPIPRRRPHVFVGAAAAILVLAAAIGVPLALLGQSTSNSAQSRASGSSAGPSVRRLAPTSHGARASGTYGLSNGATATVYALGPVSSVDGLRSRVAALGSQEFSAAAPEKQSDANATATTTTGSSSTKIRSGAGATPVQFERCLAPALRAAASTRTVSRLATATFKTTPALVYVFQAAPSASATSNAARSAVVATARDGCRVLAKTYL